MRRTFSSFSAVNFCLTILLPVFILILALIFFPSLLGRWAGLIAKPPVVVEGDDAREVSGEIEILIPGAPIDAIPKSPADVDKVPDGNELYNTSGSDIVVRLNNNGKTVSIGLEEYIVGVVSAEMPITFEPDALKAQAVAARTYAARKLSVYGGKGCSKGGADLCADPGHCQGYMDAAARKRAWGGAFEENEKKLSDAVAATLGQIITYEGKPIEAFFHSTSGGWTEDVENVFSQTLPYLRSVASRGEESAPKYSGETRIDVDEFVRIVNSRKNAGLEAASLHEQIEILSRTESGRVDTIRLGGSVLKGTEVRSLFSLNSTQFTITLEQKNILFTTKGFGHGVGMSQVGANQMAADGENYQTILAHYYTGTTIDTVN